MTTSNSSSERITASSIRYVKLGPQGAWEKLCIEEGTLRFGHREVPHAIALTRDREGIRAHLLAQGYDQSAASDKAREVLDFYDGDKDALWITFHAGRLWWCRADAEVHDLGAENPQGARYRRAAGSGWSNTSRGGLSLHTASLSGRLTRTAAYRKTTCRVVDAAPYLLARLNDEVEPEVQAVVAARNSLLDALQRMIQRLTWQDFELLVDLTFAASGWRRTGAVGGVQKTVDIELELPSTGEQAFVQVKSATNASEFRTYRDALADRPEGRMFYIFHTGDVGADVGGEDVTVIGPARIAAMALNAGLLDWTIKRAS